MFAGGSGFDLIRGYFARIQMTEGRAELFSIYQGFPWLSFWWAYNKRCQVVVIRESACESA